MTTYIIIGVLGLFLSGLIKWVISLKRRNRDLQKALERSREIAKQKEKIHTGDDTTDFNNSIELLQKYSTDRD